MGILPGALWGMMGRGQGSFLFPFPVSDIMSNVLDIKKEKNRDIICFLLC